METQSVVKQTVDKLLNIAAVVEKLDGTVPDSVYLSVNMDGVGIFPPGEQEARKIVGKMIMAFHAQPKIEKYGAKDLKAEFHHAGVPVTVYQYRGKKCAVVKKQIVHEAEPEKIVPAKEAWVEEVEELVCEMPAVEAEVQSQVQEVPF